MPRSRFAFASSVPFALALVAFSLVASSAFGAGRKLHVHYPPSTEAGELSIEANYWLWLPDGLEGKPLRGVILHQHGCGDGAELGGVTAADDLHWQELARRHDCALIGSSYRAMGAACTTWCDARNGSDAAFRRALDDFAKQADRPEIAEVPWCLWGHSGGGTWTSWMMTLHPERIVAAWLRSGTAYSQWREGESSENGLAPALLAIPFMANPGAKEKGDERFNGAWTGTLTMFEELRAQGAPAGFAPDPLRSHECGDSRYVAIPFFDACLTMRLPDADAKDRTLKPVAEEGVWLGDWESATASPRAKFEGDPKQAVWLPTEAVARAWQEYVSTGAVGDATPPPAPTDLSVVRNPDGTVIVQWDQRADFESGVGGFDLLIDGKTIASLPEMPTDRFGRPLFQRMSYHDTPEAPVPAMEFILPPDSAPAGAELSIAARNAVGLSTKSEKVEIPGER